MPPFRSQRAKIKHALGRRRSASDPLGADQTSRGGAWAGFAACHTAAWMSADAQPLTCYIAGLLRAAVGNLNCSALINRKNIATWLIRYSGTRYPGTRNQGRVPIRALLGSA